MHIDDLLKELVSREGSDLHLRVGEPPVFRIHGKPIRTNYPVITRTEDYVYPILSKKRQERFERSMELGLSYDIKGVSPDFA